jgi:hypothetical protein
VLRISKRPEPVNLVHCLSCDRHEPFCYSRRHRPTPRKHLEGQPRVCGRTQNTDNFSALLPVDRAGRVPVVTGTSGPARWSSLVTVARKSRVSNMMWLPGVKVSLLANVDVCAIRVMNVYWHAKSSLTGCTNCRGLGNRDNKICVRRGC